MNIKLLSSVELVAQLIIVGSVYGMLFKVHTLMAGLTLGSHVTYELMGWLIRRQLVVDMNKAKSEYARQINQQLGGGTA